MDIQRIGNSINTSGYTGKPGNVSIGNCREPVDVFHSGSSPETQEGRKKWTIFHYVSADNNLKEYLINDVKNTEKIGSTDNMHLVTMLDEGDDNCKVFYITQDKEKYESWTLEKQQLKELDAEIAEIKSKSEESCDLGIGESLSLLGKLHDLEKRRDEIWKENNHQSITSPVLQDMGAIDMTNPKVFVNFISKMAKKFPAEHYAIIISSHGAGWEGAIDDDFEYMPTAVMGKAFNKISKELGQKIDVVGFDACQMAAAEVAFELAGSAKYMVASQEVLGGTGWAYASFLEDADKAMSSGKELSGEDLAVTIVNNAEINKRNIPALSAINLDNLGIYKDALDRFARAILDTDTPETVFKTIANETQGFDDIDMRDHYHFAQLVSESSDIHDENVKKTARDLMKTIREDLVVTNRRFEETHPNANGVVIMFNDVHSEDFMGAFDITDYKKLKISKQTLWDEAVSKFMRD